MSFTDIPVYCGGSGDTTIKVERSQSVVRFLPPAEKVGDNFRGSLCFHIEDPQAAADLIELLQPLADKRPKPRISHHLTEERDKKSTWQLVTSSNWRFMWSPQGWMKSIDGGKTWNVMPDLNLKDGAPYASYSGFKEVL